MSHQGIVTIICFVALGALLSFAQTAKHGSVGPVSFIISLLAVPAGVAILWKLSTLFGWWTILIFVLMSLVIGVLNYRFRAKFGTSALFSLQPVLGSVYVIGATASWLI
jgi:hypothetical protein